MPPKSMTLGEKQKKHLRRLAHDRKPVVMIAQEGLKSTVLKAIEEALEYHELIKLKINVGDRDVRDNIADDICQQCACEKIQRVGNILTVYRKNMKKPKIDLPK